MYIYIVYIHVLVNFFSSTTYNRTCTYNWSFVNCMCGIQVLCSYSSESLTRLISLISCAGVPSCSCSVCTMVVGMAQ